MFGKTAVRGSMAAAIAAILVLAPAISSVARGDTLTLTTTGTWIYLTWWITLAGAVLVANLPKIRSGLIRVIRYTSSGTSASYSVYTSVGSYDISTVPSTTGTGTADYSSPSVTGAAASFNFVPENSWKTNTGSASAYPRVQMWYDSSSSKIYVPDPGNYCVRVISLSSGDNYGARSPLDRLPRLPSLRERY